MNQAAPGWYPLPSKPGVMGRWTGSEWSGEEMPIPPTAGSQPIYPDQPVGSPLNYGANPSQGQFGPFGPQNPSSSWTPASIIDTVRREAENPGNRAAGKQALGGAMIADGIVGFGKDRPSIFGAIGTIIFGILWFIGTSMFMGLFTAGNELGAGETKTQGKVVEIEMSTSTSSKGKTSRTCSPVVEFTLNGAKHTTSSQGSISPCPWRVGQSVEVLYHPNSVDSTSRVPTESKELDLFTKLFPLAGILVMIGGVWTLLVRLGTIGAGVYFWRKGSQERAKVHRKR